MHRSQLESIPIFFPSTLDVTKAATMSSRLTVGGDVSMNANVDISGDLVITGNLSVFQNKTYFGT